MFFFLMFFFFFFSSRRRHTRSLRDWSSDVCSSDLGAVQVQSGPARRVPGHLGRPGGDALPALQRAGRSRRSRPRGEDRKSTRLNSSHVEISYAVFCLKKKKKTSPKPQTPYRPSPDT